MSQSFKDIAGVREWNWQIENAWFLKVLFCCVISSLGMTLGNIHVGFFFCNRPHEQQYMYLFLRALDSALFVLVQVFLLSHGLKNGNKTTRLIQRKEKHFKRIVKKHDIGPSALHQLTEVLRKWGSAFTQLFICPYINTERKQRPPWTNFTHEHSVICWAAHSRPRRPSPRIRAQYL